MSTKLISHLHLREQVIKQIRSYLTERGFHEVFPTLLSDSLPLEPTLYAYETTNHNFLPTSPEASVKKYLTLTNEKCFAISPTFRSLEVDTPLHRSEFLMLEVYEPEQTYQYMMSLVRDIILSPIHPNSWNETWAALSLVDLFKQYVGVDLNSLFDYQGMIHFALERGYKTKNATWEQLFNQIYLNDIEPHLPLEPFFLTDYPTQISPLASQQKNNPNLSERFELFINRVELANGNTENSNSSQIRKFMEAEQQYRKNNNLPVAPIDTEFLKVVGKLPHPTSGFGLGIDRLVMLLNGQKSLPI